MVKKIQIILEFEPYVPNPENYPTAKSIEDMAAIDMRNCAGLTNMLLEDIKYNLYYKIIDEDE
jgi:hypothetical protein